MKKRILIVGSIGDFGGREVEVKTIIDTLSQKYDVMLFSTVPITEKSMAVSGQSCLWSSLHKELYDSNFFLKGLSLLSKKWNKSNIPPYLLVSNKISSVFFNFDAENRRVLKKQVALADVVLFCGVFANGFLKEFIISCLSVEKPFLMRTTGTITEIPKEIKENLSNINALLVHSHSNAVVLKDMGLDNIDIIDQTTLAEKNLIDLIINQSNQLIFGYIGRFSPEKGIIELLELFKKLGEKLIIAGNGPLLTVLESICNDNLNLEYIGEISTNKIHSFFEKIDVLIIPSYEEAGPLVGIEAMAGGKLIFSTKVGAMEERLYKTKNDFWFDINDENTFLEIYKRLKNISLEEIQEIREVNRKKYLENYSIEIVSKQYEQVVENVLKN